MGVWQHYRGTEALTLDSLLLRKLFRRRNKAEATSPKKTPFPSGVRVLVVDDSKTFQYSTHKMLKQAGVETLQALDGELGLKMARRFKPELILMDVVMPGINGFQATRELHRDPETKDIPVIIVSGNAEATEQFWVLKVGAVDFMSKPFTRKELMEKLNRYLSKNDVA